jgi:hypothetical protein
MLISLAQHGACILTQSNTAGERKKGIQVEKDKV